MNLFGVFLLILCASSAEARVFDLKSATMAPYFRGTGGTTPLGQDAFIHGSGTGTDIKSKSNYNYSGELGLSLNMSDRLNIRLGAELLSAIPVSNAAGNNSSSGAERFMLNSNITVFNPNVTLEILTMMGKNSRFYNTLGVGYASADLKNSYTMTTTGTSELSGLTSFDEKATGSSISYTTAVGFETIFADNVTMSLELGYRYLQFSNLSHTGTAKTIAQGDVQKGDTLKNADGTSRRIDLGGAFVGLTFRFYLDFGR